MERRQNAEHLRTVQYATSAKLAARIALHQRFSTNPQSLHEWLFAQMALRPGARVLEVGAGAGTLWAANVAQAAAFDLVLTDLSEGMLGDARSALAAVLPAARFATCDVQHLPFATGTFDVIVANFMLYHVPDLRLALRELRRVLQPSGVVVAATFGAPHLIELDALYASVGHQPEDAQSSASFGLETGAVALAEHFASIETRRFDDALVVTEVEPVIAYLDSMLAADALDESSRARVHSAAATLVARPGGWRITKDAGVLIAR